MSPSEDSVCSPPSPYIGDEGDDTESTIPLSVCPPEPSRYAGCRGDDLVCSELSLSPRRLSVSLSFGGLASSLGSLRHISEASRR